MLKQAVDIGRAAGLHFVYAGNMPGHVGDLENTHCPSCNKTLIERYGYHISKYLITAEGRCPSCNAAIPGRWSERFEGQIASSPYLPYFRHRGAQLTTLD
jgi:pyruvate formate lyase activating enzyme